MAYDKVVDSAQLDADLKIVADAIREKGGTTEQLSFPQGMKQAVDSIQIGGSDENIINLEHAYSCYQMFYNVVFPEGYESIIDAPNCTNTEQMYAATSGVGKIVALIGYADGVTTRWKQTFRNTKASIIDVRKCDFSKATNLEWTFSSADIKEILGEIDMSATKTIPCDNTFNYVMLKEVRFKKETIYNSLNIPSRSLSNESIQSIIDGLADLTGETAKIITLSADVKAKLTDEQITTITSKNWTLA